MIPSLAMRALITTTLLVAVVGAVDATIGEAYDLVAVFFTIALVQLVLLIRLGRRRRDITLRADLAVWIRDRAATQAESSEAVLDRAVAAYRADLVGSPEPNREP
ncbi:MAG: hypothetical protein GY929_00805 [Actinomycetia bacterium]|nr:hypothetical protein [Actinomycetes bacterium]